MIMMSTLCQRALEGCQLSISHDTTEEEERNKARKKETKIRRTKKERKKKTNKQTNKETNEFKETCTRKEN